MASETTTGLREDTALSILNPTPTRFPGPTLLHHLLRLELRQNDTAVHYLSSSWAKTSLTYGDLHCQAEALASRISSALHRDPGREKLQSGSSQLIIPILVPQCPDLYVSLLAVLKAGGAFCPLNLDAPPDRVKFVLQDISARIVLTTTDLSHKIPSEGSNVSIITVDAPQESGSNDEACPALTTRRDACASDLAYVMYTSGSTGTPKGVGISHDAATQSLLAHDQHIPSFRRFLQFAAPTFDVSVFEIFFPLFRGTTLVCADRRLMLDDLPAVLREMAVDGCELTPTVAASLLRKRDNAPNLKLLLTIGEMLTGPVVEEFGGRRDGVESMLWAMYGPTEATIHCTLQPAFEANSTVNNIGMPLSTVSAFILPLPEERPHADTNSQAMPCDPVVLPIGEMGELAIGGFQLAEGYINRPEQTAAAFTQTATYGRLYRTGDKARLRPDGILECFGRISEGQVKLRGQRIELGEIEAAVLRVDGCHSAVAAVVEGRVLVVFCVVDLPDTHQHSTQDTIMEACSRWLPRFMHPNDVVVLEKLPRLASGKADRKRLVSEYQLSRGSASSTSPSEPSSIDQLEGDLCNTAENVLGRAVLPLDSLASLGLDSLLSIRFASLLQRSGLAVRTIDVLESRTISHLCARIRRPRKGQASLSEDLLAHIDVELELAYVLEQAPSLLPDQAQIEAVLPCTPLQVSMLAETAKNPQAYCNWIELEFPTDCDAEQILAAFQDLSQRNEILRSGFVHLLDGRFVQVVWRNLSLPLQAEDNALTSRRDAQGNGSLDGQDLSRPLALHLTRRDGRLRMRIAIHHALYDGWSMDMMMLDLEVLLRGQEPAPRPQFRALSQYYASDAYVNASNDARAFWAQQLLGFQPSPFPLLVSAASDGSDTTRSQTCAIEIDPGYLEGLTRHNECSVQAVFQAGLLWLWGAILGVEDIVIGTITSGRTIPIMGVENIVGPCLASVPVRAKLGEVRTLKELLRYLHSANRTLIPHSILPLSEIKKSAGVSPTQSLYDVLFVYQESLASRRRGDTGAVREVAHQDYLESKLLVEIEPSVREFSCRITYHTGFLPSEYVSGLAEQFRCILRHLVHSLDTPVASLRHSFSDTLLSQHNTPPTALEGSADLASLVEMTAARFPDKPAVCFADAILPDSMAQMRTVSYDELNRMANRIGRLIQSLAAEVGTPVAIIMEKSVDLYAGILGILKSGCAYLPLLPSTPLQRIDTILAQAGVRICLTDAATAQCLESLEHNLHLINFGESSFEGLSDENLCVAPHPSRLANIIYTSGSTGIPKGVCVTQLNIASNLEVLSRIYPLSSREGSPRMLQSCSQAFDVSVFEIFFAWKNAMCLCSATNDTLFADLEHAIRALRVTHLSMTPTVASLIDPRNVPGVEFLVTSGEPMTEQVAEKWTGLLYQGYGPSETTNICTVKKMSPGDPIRHLGHGFENTSSFVLYKDGPADLAPYGCVGELCFGGDQVVKGYLGMPELTSQKFIEHPRHGRLYRTGDLGRMLPDGSLVIIGRMDDQIKLRGQRIETKEIDAVIRESGESTSVLTMSLARGDSKVDQLATFYVPVAQGSMDANNTQHRTSYILIGEASPLLAVNQTLFHLLASRLATYMVPSYLIPLSAMPMTPSGKVDKALLRQLFANLDQATLNLISAGASDSNDVGESWSEVETTIAQTIADALSADVQHIRKWSPLSSIGLDSISAITVARRLRTSLGLKLSISQVLQSACVARLAQLVKESVKLADEGASSYHADVSFFEESFVAEIQGRFGSRNLEAILPCTPLQEGMLAVSTGSNNSSYLNQMVFKLALPGKDMRRCWDALVCRHAILRTCFLATEMAAHPIIQVVLKDWAPKWHAFDMSASQPALGDCLRASGTTLAPAIDSMEPPVSFALARCHDAEYFIFTCHHALYDGVAVERLLQEAEWLLAPGQQTLLPPPPQYEYFLREMLALPKDSDAFWRRQLEGFQPRSLPCPGIPVGQGESPVEHLDLGVSLDEINGRLKEMGVSLLAMCQSSWAVSLSVLLGHTDVCFGNVVSGRSVAVDGIEHLVAPCFNTIPVRADVANARHYIGLARSLQQSGIETLRYQFTSLRQIQSLHAAAARSARLFNTLLLLQQPPRPLDRRIWTLERDDGTMDVPLVCELIPDPQSNLLQVKLHYDSSLVSTLLVSFVSRLFLHAFRTALAYPSAPVLTRASLPDELLRMMDSLELRQDTHTATGLPPATQVIPHSEEWISTEGVVRTVLAGLSSTAEAAIGKHTTIYQLGLDSISAVQIAAALRKRQFRLSATDVMEHPTCHRLATFIDSSQSNDAPNLPIYDLHAFQAECYEQLARDPACCYVADRVFPCTPLQHGMLTEFINSKGHNYFNFLHLNISNPGATLGNILGSWKQVVSIYEMLRVGFVAVDHKDASFAMVGRSDVEGILAAQVDVAANHDAGAFDLGRWRSGARKSACDALDQPPWRLALVKDDLGAVQIHLAIHHALYDAHSLNSILEDFAAASGGMRIHTSHNSGIAAAVSDIMAQNMVSKSEARDFWRDLSPRVVVNRFPVMTPLRVEQRTICVEKTLGSFPFSKLEEAARLSGVSIQALIQAAWTRILCSYLGEPSVVFGVVLSGRNTDATQNAAFPCITTLPVFSENSASNRELLQLMMAYNARLHRHQQVSLAQIQGWLGLADTHLFDTLLVYQKFEEQVESPGDRSWKIIDDTATVDYPVSLEIEPHDDLLHHRITFYDDVLPSDQAVLLLRQFDSALAHLAFQPDAQEDDLWVSAPSLFSITPASNPELPSDVVLLHQFVERMALSSPDRTALEFVSSFDSDGEPVRRTWSYGELDANGNRIANLLEPHTQTGGIVGVCFDKCPEAYFSILGILKAGCAFVALDPGAPPARRQFILEDSGATTLLTDTDRSAVLDFVTSVPAIAVDEQVLNALSPHPLQERQLQLSANDRCYCLYTSGTTGTPKGCEITHENAVQAMLAFQELFSGHWDEDSKWLQFASFHFDVSVLEQYWSWGVGITLVAAPRDLILEDLVAMISRMEITHIDLTPSLARLVHPDEVPSLCRGVFITGGEQLKQEILDVWGDAGVIYNAYGPTEATIGVTTYQRVPRTGRSTNIGRQFSNVGSYIFKAGTETPVFKGGVGELCVSGKLVGKGYLNRGDLTLERFPSLTRFGGERVYRTGDLVRILHDGCFDFLGRADDQVKLRGQRLEIGEINHSIRAGVPQVEDVATLVIRDEKKQKDLLVSFVVSKDFATARSGGGQPLRPIIATDDGTSKPALARDVQGACRTRLPGYMVPTYIVQLPFIPLSSNNKAEVKQLRELFNSMTSEELIAASAAGPRANSALDGDVAQKVLAALRAMHLLEGSHSPSAETSIFELGIDSISVLRFSRALKRGGLDQATPALILKHPIVGDLVHALQTDATSRDAGAVLEARQLVEVCQHRNRAQACRVLGVTSDQIEYIAPCSALQHGMISISRNEESVGAYFNVFTFELHDNVDVPRLKASWQTILDSFSILRTRFLTSTEGSIQVALKEVALPWDEIDADARRDDETQRTVFQSLQDRWIERNSKDVTAPMELHLVRFPAQQRVLLKLHIFHGLYDANSLGMIVAKAAALYLGTEPIESRTTFIDALVHGPLRNFSYTKNFWENHLLGAELVPLPRLCPNPAKSVISSSRSLDFAILEPARQQLNVTHSAVVQALWLSVLCARVQSRVTIGVVLFGRAIDVENAEHVVGPLFNTLPFHLPDTASCHTWAGLVEYCHSFNTSTLPFQHTPLRDIQKWCSGGRPLFDTLFSCQRESLPSPAGAGALWTEVSSEDLTPDYPLAFEATLTRDNHLELLLVAQAGVADEDALAGLLSEFHQAMLMMKQDVQGQWSARSRLGVAGTDSSPPTASCKQNTDSHTTRTAPFIWTDAALVLRSEIASLAGVISDDISDTTRLLELGLDSIDTIKLSARLKKHDLTLTNSQLVKGQTIKEYVDMLGQAVGRDGKNPISTSAVQARLLRTAALRTHIVDSSGSLDAAMVETVLPPTPLQEAMVADTLDSGFRRYYNHDVLEILPGVELNRLREAWQTVIDGSPVLRTVFVQIDDTDLDFAFCQVVLREMKLGWEVRELATTADIQGEMELSRQRAELSAGMANLLQLTPIRVGEQNFLILSIAHALYDGWSLDLLHCDVRDAYAGQFKLRQSYVDYLSHMLLSASSEANDFWVDSLTGATPTSIQPQKLQVGALKEKDQLQSSPMLVHRLETESPVSAAGLLSFCRRQAVSLQVVGQVCWAAVLSRRTQSLDVIFGSVLSGRETEAAEGLLFPTMNTVAVRTVLHGTVGTLLRYVQENMAGINQYQHFPLRKAQRLGGAGSAGEALFNTLFILQKRRADQTADDEDNATIMRSVDGSSSVEYPICVEMEIVGSKKVVWRTACDDYFLSKRETAELLGEVDSVLQFLLRSSHDTSIFTSSVAVSVGGASASSEVSVCGLPPFHLRTRNSSSSATEFSAQTDSSTLVEDEDWSPLQETIRDVLARVSGAADPSSVKKTYNMYHLGLDSISAIKVSSLLRKRGVKLRAPELLGAESLEEMAAIASSRVASQSLPSKTAARSASQAMVPKDVKTDEEAALQSILDRVGDLDLVRIAGLESEDIQKMLPASAMQVHMISTWQKSDGEVFFPEFRYRLSGVKDNFDVDDVTAAWRALVHEMSILRTVFLPTGIPAVPFVQIVLDPAAPYCLRSFSDTGSLDNHSREEDSAVFSVQRLVHLAATKNSVGTGCNWALSLKILHALYDGFSLPAIMTRFEELLASRNDNKLPIPRDVPAGEVAGEWVSLVAQQVSGPAINARRAFWTDYLRGAAATPFTGPSSTVIPDSDANRSRVSKFTPRAVSDVSLLRETCASNGVSIQAAFLAAVARILQTGGRADVVFGIYVANRQQQTQHSRDDSEQDPLAYYPTLTLLPLRVRCGRGADLVTAARTIQQDLASIMADQANMSVGLWEIEEWTGVRVDCFVNFLSHPSVEQTGLAEGVSLKQLHISDETQPLLASEAWETKPCGQLILETNVVRESFPDTVDIEAALGHGGGLDIGVFGPASMLGGDRGAENVISTLVEFLELQVE
ncbi:gramicidin S synthetase 1 [Magnaporthiopsis poae ATCC 64411]|uniref:Gramicidin S synthetase 1 n=1 Tax=Magnaporthiopsis poae (strain ATCC 64411 / 73-15) TaxID=644358 RepID=A0A0C4DYH3_MAGP6|nr:gramicidin S synthetase 1 [Magnaporthiopsis poae ATCC 64411]